MTEVGGTAAFYISRRPAMLEGKAWATASAQVIQQVVAHGPAERAATKAAGLANADRFGATAALDQLAAMYQHILQTATLA